MVLGINQLNLRSACFQSRHVEKVGTNPYAGLVAAARVPDPDTTPFPQHSTAVWLAFAALADTVRSCSNVPSQREDC